MLSVTLLASILAAAASSASISNADTPNVRQSANGEFITKHYPHGALSKGEQGKVSFEVTIEPDGALGSCEVTGSSGFATLDRETCEFIAKFAKLQPVRNAEGRTIRAVQQGYINWQLPAGARQVATAANVKGQTDRFGKPLDMNKTICRTTARTGSRVGSTKVCMSRSDWTRQERVTRDGIQVMQGGGSGCAPTTPCRRR